MFSVDTLPPEVWLVIFDFVLAASLSKLHTSDHYGFPEFIEEARDPWKHPPAIGPLLGNLRLVCRTFNALAGPSTASPYAFIKITNTSISNSTRAVYIYPSGEAQVLLQHALADRSMCQRIVVLNLPGGNVHMNGEPTIPVLFELLITKAASLPNLQSLTLGLYEWTHDHEMIRPATVKFWSRLNRAFPSLVCLTLRGCLTTRPETQPVIFQKLEILDLGEVLADPSVDFPALRHASVRLFEINMSQTSSRLNDCTSLESLLLSDTEFRASQFSWALIPRVRVLGVPSMALTSIARVPPDHPLQHLYVYVHPVWKHNDNPDPGRKEREANWMKKLLGKFPTQQITLECTSVTDHSVSVILADFDEEWLEGMGLARDKRYRERNKETYHVVLRRANVEGRIESLDGISSAGIEQVSKRTDFGLFWRRFHNFASRKLQL